MRALILIFGIALGVGATVWVLERPALLSLRESRVAAPGAHDDDESSSRVERVNGVVRLHLDAPTRRLADIQTATPAAARMAREEQAYGQVIDSGELLSLLRDLRAAQAAARAQQELASALAARVQRLRSLAARGEIIVARELAALDIEYRREAATATAHAATVEARRTTLGARWGRTLAATETDHRAVLAPLEAGSAQLVAFACAASPPAEVYAGLDAQRVTALPVEVVGSAPEIVGNTQAASYFGLMRSPALRIGMHLTFWIPLHEAARQGHVLPATALVWQSGAQWYFVEVEPGVFERRPVGESFAHPEGLLVQGLATGTRVVTRGAQALLAEEFRQQIPEEDDD
jgi:hypothetical protein